MCGSGSDTVKERRSQSFVVSRRSAHLRAVTASSRERHTHISDTSGKSRFQNKPGEELSNSFTGNSLLGSQVEFCEVSGVPIRRTHREVSPLPLSLPKREFSLLRDMSSTTGPDGLNSVSDSPRTAENEGFSELDSVTRHSPHEPSQTQSARLTRMHERSPSLESPVFSQERMPSGSGSNEKSGDDRCISHGLGGSVRGQNSEGSVVSVTEREAHKFSRTTDSVTGPETFCAFSQKSSCISQNRQYNGDSLHKSTRGGAVSPASLVSERTNYMEQQEPLVITRDACSRNNEQGSGFTVQRESPVRGVETPPSGDAHVVAEIRPGSRRSLRIARKRAMPSVLLSGGRRCTAGCGCSSPRVARRVTLRVPSVEPDRADTTESSGRQACNDSDRTTLAGQTMDCGDRATTIRPTVAITSAQRSSLTSTGGNISPLPSETNSLGLARERLNLNIAGLPPKVIETIQNARAASTRSLYDLKWRVFESWCAERNIVPFLCSVSDVLCFLQELLEKGRAFSTIKVYLSAISACHMGFNSGTIGQHPLVCRFMRGARRLHPVSKPLVPPWDLSVVLNALSKAPFEPIDLIDLKLLTLKTAVLLALTTAKRVSELHALSVHPSCMMFAPGVQRVSFRTNPAFVPKVFDHAGAAQSVDLLAFHPPPFTSPEEERLHNLCPVRTLHMYVQRTQTLRQSNQLFVSWAESYRGRPISRQRLSHWIVEGIVLCYNNSNIEPPKGLRAHSTRGMATSWALFKGISIQEICAAASWSSPHTFARFYSLDVTEPSLAHSVLEVNSRVA
nr:uncharacterized protein LOC129451681 [Misgurnus anguillicaudatus]